MTAIGCLIAAATLVTPTTGAGADDGSPATPPPGPEPSGLVPAPGTVEIPLVESVHPLVRESTDCDEIRSTLAELAAAGVEKVVCSQEASSDPGGPQPMSPYPTPEQECALDGVANSWYYNREWFCLISQNNTVDTIDTGTGAVIGRAVYALTHASGLDPRSTIWSNYSAFYLASAWGDAATIVDGTVRCFGCDGGTNFAIVVEGPRTVALGQAVTGRENLSDVPANVVDDDIRIRWTDGFTCAGCVGWAYIFKEFPRMIRCDVEANVNGHPGCSIPSYTPQLKLTGYSSGNTSTAFMRFIQTNNVDHWGKYPSGQPLSRLSNSAQATANRTAMCAGFTPLPTVQNDTCDEFPFAKTYQSGNMLGQAASQCSQVIPQWVSGTTWQFATMPGYSTSQRCGIGHVRGADNFSTGGMYGAFIQNNRVLDGDPFWVGMFN